VIAAQQEASRRIGTTAAQVARMARRAGRTDYHRLAFLVCGPRMPHSRQAGRAIPSPLRRR